MADRAAVNLVCAVREYFDNGGPANRLRQAAVGQTGLIADAARAVVRGGRHSGPCVFDGPEGSCSIHLRTGRARRAELARLIGR